MKKLLMTGVAAIALVAFVSGNVQAQSAKFAAVYSKAIKTVKAEIFSDEDGVTTGAICTGDGAGSGTSGDPCILAVANMATIHVAQAKELLIGVSGEIGLVTLTQAKGKTSDPTLGSATASGKVEVTLMLKNTNTGEESVAEPGTVTFAARLQELKVSAECIDVVPDTCDDFDIEVIVSLKLDTTAAHHFNFLGIDLDQGMYEVKAIFDLSAFVAIVGEDAIAEAEVILGPRMVTVQEVRAVKDSILEVF